MSKRKSKDDGEQSLLQTSSLLLTSSVLAFHLFAFLLAERILVGAFQTEIIERILIRQNFWRWFAYNWNLKMRGPCSTSNNSLTSASVSEKSKICKCYYILYRYKIVIVINVYVAVLQKPLLVGALGDHANSTLGQLAEKNLGRCFSVFGGQALDNGI